MCSRVPQKSLVTLYNVVSVEVGERVTKPDGSRREEPLDLDIYMKSIAERRQRGSTVGKTQIRKYMYFCAKPQAQARRSTAYSRVHSEPEIVNTESSIPQEMMASREAIQYEHSAAL